MELSRIQKVQTETKFQSVALSRIQFSATDLLLYSNAYS